MRKIITFIAIVILSSCGNKNSNYSENIREFDIKTNTISGIDNFIEEYFYVPLETGSDFIISNIETIKINKDKIIILDNNGYKLYIFDMNGKLVSKINKRGKGNGEFIAVNDFELSDSVLYVLSRAEKKINIYDIRGSFKKQINLNDWYKKFKILDNDLICLYSERSNNQKWDFVIFDTKNEKYINHFEEIKTDESYGFQVSPFNQMQSGELYITKPFDYVIYELNKDYYRPYCKFNFDTKDKLPNDYNKLNYSELAEQTKGKTVVKRISMFIQNDTYKYIIYSLFIDELGIRDHISRIDEIGSVDTYRFGDIGENKIPFLAPPIAYYNNYLVSYYSAFVLLDIEKNRSSSYFANKGIRDTDNPILFFYKLK